MKDVVAAGFVIYENFAACIGTHEALQHPAVFAVVERGVEKAQDTLATTVEWKHVLANPSIMELAQALKIDKKRIFNAARERALAEKTSVKTEFIENKGMKSSNGECPFGHDKKLKPE